MRSFIILLGIVVLVASIGGALLVHQQTEPTEIVQIDDPNTVVCWGCFDIKDGITPLDPRQAGIIVKLAAENIQVKKGDVLLQVDDTLAQLKVREAQAAVKVAETLLTEAKLLTDKYKFEQEQQKSVIDALAHEKKVIENQRDTELRSASGPRRDTVTELYKALLGKLADRKKADEAKFKQLKLLNANLKIDQAMSDLESKQIQVDAAQEMLNYYKIVAPCDGTVLRVYVHEGETLAPGQKQAIDFLPEAPILVRAEVLQEWGEKVHKGQSVVIEDDIYRGTTWKGTVRSVSKWYATTRNPVIEPFRKNDVRTLECLIDLEEGDTPKAIGQRVRAKIRIKS